MQNLKRGTAFLSLLLTFFFSLPNFCPAQEQEPEAKPQNITDDADKKKLKKLKRMSNTQTGFEQAFEQFATSTINNSKKTMYTHFDTTSTSNIMEESPAQVRLVVTKNHFILHFLMC